MNQKRGEQEKGGRKGGKRERETERMREGENG